MGTSFRDSVEQCFRPLVHEHGFRVHTAGYDRRDFGNAVVVLESDECSIRVVRDRGQVFVELASAAEPGNWFPLERVIEAIGGSASGLAPAMELEAASSLIEANYSRLAECLGPLRYPETKRELERLGELAKQRFLSRLQPRG